MNECGADGDKVAAGRKKKRRKGVVERSRIKGCLISVKFTNLLTSSASILHFGATHFDTLGRNIRL
jgi:hypothetical protein